MIVSVSVSVRGREGVSVRGEWEESEYENVYA